MSPVKPVSAGRPSGFDAVVDPGALIATLTGSVTTERRRPRPVTGGVAEQQPGVLADTPVLLIPCFGLARETAADLFRVLYRAQLITMAFRPMIYTDTDVFAEARPYGWVVEHHMSEYHWRRLGAGGDWLTSVRDHAEYLIEFFDIATVATPDAHSLHRDLLDRVSALAGIDVGHLADGMHRPADPRPVQGWRGWPQSVGSVALGLVVGCATTGTLEVSARRGDSGHLLVIDERTAESADLVEFTDDAIRDGWSVVRLSSAPSLDELERGMCLASLRDAFSIRGLCVTVAGPGVFEDLATTHRASDVLHLTAASGHLQHQGERASFGPVRTRAMVTQASRLLARSGHAFGLGQ